MYYPQNRDAEHRESEQRIAEHYRRAESVERFADRSHIFTAIQNAKREGFDNFAKALQEYCEKYE